MAFVGQSATRRAVLMASFVFLIYMNIEYSSLRGIKKIPMERGYISIRAGLVTCPTMGMGDVIEI